MEDDIILIKKVENIKILLDDFARLNKDKNVSENPHTAMSKYNQNISNLEEANDYIENLMLRIKTKFYTIENLGNEYYKEINKAMQALDGIESFFKKESELLTIDCIPVNDNLFIENTEDNIKYEKIYDDEYLSAVNLNDEEQIENDSFEAVLRSIDENSDGNLSPIDLDEEEYASFFEKLNRSN